MNYSLPFLLVIYFFKTQMLWAQKEYPAPPRIEPLPSFEKVYVYSGLAVNLIPANENKAIIYGDLYHGIRVKFRRGKLKIRKGLSDLLENNNAYIDLYYNDTPEGILLHQGATVYCDTTLLSNKLLIKAHEGAQFAGNVSTRFLITKARTGGSIHLVGNTQKHLIRVSTGGICETSDLLAQNTNARIFSGGEVTLFNKKEVEAHVALGGYIWIRGNPKSVVAKRTIAGEIYKFNGHKLLTPRKHTKINAIHLENSNQP